MTEAVHLESVFEYFGLDLLTLLVSELLPKRAKVVALEQEANDCLLSFWVRLSSLHALVRLSLG